MRLFNFLLVAALCCWVSPASAQPTRLWQRTYAYGFETYYVQFHRLSGTRLVGVGGSYDPGVTGDTVTTGAYLGFYNNAGDTVRTRQYMTGRRIDSQQLFEADGQFQAMAAQADGHLLVTGIIGGGTRQGMPVATTAFIARLDSTGNLLWTRPFQVNNSVAGNQQLVALPDGGALFTCTPPYPGSQTVSVAAAVRFDSTGAIVWQRTYGRPYSQFSRIAALPDGSYALAGYEFRSVPGQPYVIPDGWLLRITVSGDTISSRYFGTPLGREGFVDVQAAPHGGILLTGNAGSGVQPAATIRGWVVQLDSLGRLQWQHQLPATPNTSNPNYNLRVGWSLAGGGALLSGTRLHPGSASQPLDQCLVALQPDGGGGAQVRWQRLAPLQPAEPNAHLDFSRAGEVTLAGNYTLPRAAYNGTALTRLQLTERPFVPNLCQTPPVASFAYGLNASGDSLLLLNASTPGPRYAQLVAWHWDFGDGTHYYGPTPPPHRYAAGTPASTALRLRVTNNLGCTSSQVLFPLALGTAAQRRLQAQLSVFPNPAPAATVTVQLPNLRPQGSVPVELLNALGQVVRRATWPRDQLAQGTALDLAGLTSGVYTLRLRPQEGALVKRLMVQ